MSCRVFVIPMQAAVSFERCVEYEYTSGLVRLDVVMIVVGVAMVNVHEI